MRGFEPESPPSTPETGIRNIEYVDDLKQHGAGPSEGYSLQHVLQAREEKAHRMCAAGAGGKPRK
jgi:hypothetical protein